MEIKPDWGCDGGIFLRSTEAGQAYQVMLDYLPGGNIGGIYGEGLKGVGPQRPANAPRMTPEERAAAARKRNEAWQRVWKREDWNSIRVRMEGVVPNIKVWLNGELITDFTDTANHAIDGAESGMIALQMHFSDENTPRWVDAGFWRWRNIAIKELPD